LHGCIPCFGQISVRTELEPRTRSLRSASAAPCLAAKDAHRERHPLGSEFESITKLYAVDPGGNMKALKRLARSASLSIVILCIWG
jgi:hypothetical protein